ncbi:HD family phosphohydrolase [Nitriliruptor alkaliphilus]|uniref:HD family phosphohydrolase n=1 Tax=Nitriliruptor alkaliphilus TaxID=427918 RepID=UPI000698E99C|nr:HDIG domain-containing metalloprotein [Nitriliruptor alkaliphilus]
MSETATRRLLLQRLLAAAMVAVLVPLLIGIGSVADEQPIVEGQPAPRTVIANEQVRIEDREQTETLRAQAAEGVAPITTPDRDAQTAIVQDARAAFSAARSAREPVQIEVEADEDGASLARTPSRSEQIDAVLAAVPSLGEEVAEALVAVSDDDLDAVERETLGLVTNLARERVTAEDLDPVVDAAVEEETAVRAFPGDTGREVAAPLARAVMRPTLVTDAEATREARQRAAEEVGEVARVWNAGEAIVRQNQVVESLEFRAIERLGQLGSSPLRALGRSGIASLLLIAVAAVYLQRMQPRVWVSGKKLILLGVLTSAFAALVVGTSVVTDLTSPGIAYVVPAGAYAMLVALLIHPVVGIATMLPAAVLVLLASPTRGALALFAAATVLVSVPLTTRIAARSDLRSATLRAAVAYPLLAVGTVAVFGPNDDLLVALGAGALGGLATALVVQGAMPFLENLFRLPTVTALLDLSDRNHPLLRELETKALGSYNHSVMVASLTERACREVGADPLLGTVAALYHDIGKVRQPHFFIENQQGIANPHDDLEPEVSAVIIQNHVKDGVEMATEYRLPPEVVACIGSHHGTMLVGYFYDKAVKAAIAAGGDADEVDEGHFRYHGHKPRSKEAAILLLADCCEATTRAMAMSRGTLPRDEIEDTVDRLLEERVDDGQFDDCDLTFRELRAARDTIVESLVGIYHPRIAYPAKPAGEEGASEAERPKQAQR